MLYEGLFGGRSHTAVLTPPCARDTSPGDLFLRKPSCQDPDVSSSGSVAGFQKLSRITSTVITLENIESIFYSFFLVSLSLSPSPDKLPS